MKFYVNKRWWFLAKPPTDSFGWAAPTVVRTLAHLPRESEESVIYWALANEIRLLRADFEEHKLKNHMDSPASPENAAAIGDLLRTIGGLGPYER